MFQTAPRRARNSPTRSPSCALPDPVVLALPRGGVPVALPVAKRAGRAARPPAGAQDRDARQPRTGRGRGCRRPAHRWCSTRRCCALHRADAGGFRRGQSREKRAEIEARRAAWLAGREPGGRSTGRTAIVVDDGIATGATVKAALQGLATRAAPREVILAVPVAPPTPSHEPRAAMRRHRLPRDRPPSSMRSARITGCSPRWRTTRSPNARGTGKEGQDT